MATAVQQRHFLTVDETALRLRVSARTIRRLIANGELPVVRVGSQIRIDEAELEAWLNERHRPMRNGNDDTIPKAESR
jgi:excisionase family DNA binding protein